MPEQVQRFDVPKNLYCYLILAPPLTISAATYVASLVFIAPGCSSSLANADGVCTLSQMNLESEISGLK